MSNSHKKIGTWPTPEIALLGINRIDTVPLPEKVADLLRGSWVTWDSAVLAEIKFDDKVCKAFEVSIRSDIACLYKYGKENLVIVSQDSRLKGLAAEEANPGQHEDDSEQGQWLSQVQVRTSALFSATKR